MSVKSLFGLPALVRRRLVLLRERLSARQRSLRRLGAGPIHRILVVCYGNIYRSPFLAEFLAAKLAGVATVRSAGFHLVAGRCSPPRHIEMSARLGVPLHGHRSAIVSAADLAWSDLIVLMDRHNWDELYRRGADVHKLIWAGSLAGDEVEVADPYLLDDAYVEQVMRQLLRSGEQLVAAVRRSHDEGLGK